MDEQRALALVLSTMRGEERSIHSASAIGYVRSPEAIRRMIATALKACALPDEWLDAFHVQWTERGHRMRDAVGDDNMLADALWRLLPPYHGPGLTLFRGEQAARFDAGRIGFNWTEGRPTGEMFAGGLSASYPGGGVLLQALVDRDSVIAGSIAHSRYLGEHEIVVDPRRLENVTEIKRYPRI